MSTEPVYHCPVCGREFDHPVQFCSQCGTPNQTAQRKQQIETILHSREPAPVSGMSFAPVSPASPAAGAVPEGAPVQMPPAGFPFPAGEPAPPVFQEAGSYDVTVPIKQRSGKVWWLVGGGVLLAVIALVAVIVSAVYISDPQSSPKRLANEFIRLYEKGDFASICDLVHPEVLEENDIRKSDLPSDAWSTGDEPSYNLRYVDALVGADNKIAVCFLEYDLQSDPVTGSMMSLDFTRRDGKWYLGDSALYMLTWSTSKP